MQFVRASEKLLLPDAVENRGVQRLKYMLVGLACLYAFMDITIVFTLITSGYFDLKGLVSQIFVSISFVVIDIVLLHPIIMIDYETTLKTQVLQHTGEVFIVAVSRHDNKQVYRFKMRELSEQRAGADASIYQKRRS